jgi:hypothetical protein
MTCGDYGGLTTKGEPCKRAAGWGVPGTDEGRCKTHLAQEPEPPAWPVVLDAPIDHRLTVEELGQPTTRVTVDAVPVEVVVPPPPPPGPTGAVFQLPGSAFTVVGDVREANGVYYFHGGHIRVDAVWPISNAFCLTALIRPDDVLADRDFGIISRNHGSAANIERYHLGVNRDGSINARRASGGVTLRLDTTPGLVRSAETARVSADYNGAHLIAYVNGAEVGRIAATGPVDSSDLPLLIGARGDDRRYHGAITGLRIYDRSLSADEHAALAAGDSPIPAEPSISLKLIFPLSVTRNADGNVELEEGESVQYNVVKWVDATPYVAVDGRWREAAVPCETLEDIHILPGGRDGGVADVTVTSDDVEVVQVHAG